MERKSTALKIVFLLLFLAWGSVKVNGQVYVDQSATGAGDGSSWANAFTDLQSGIDAAAAIASASSPVEVWVAAGDYYPTTSQSGTDRTAVFNMKDNVELYGGFDGSETMLSQRDWNINQTVLSADIGVQNDSTDNSYGIMKVDGTNVSDIVVFDGLEFKGAFSLSQSGGAISMTGQVGDLEIRNCTFRYNLVNNGACINATSAVITSNILIENSRFLTNGFYATSAYLGSAIHVGNSVQVFNSIFIDNKSGQGGVFYLRNGSVVDVINCTFTENGAGSGAVAVAGSGSSLTFKNNIVWGNTKTASMTDNPFSLSATATISNNIIEGGWGGNNLNQDPEFFDEATNDLRIKHCSSAIDIGDDSEISGYTQDIIGESRIFGSAVDAGAYESQNSPLSFGAVEAQDVLCSGGSDGIINVNGSGGSGTIQYSIDGVNFSSSQSFTGLSAGSYTITLLDPSNGCTYAESFIINEPTSLGISTLTKTDISCNGVADGKINVGVFGGSPPYRVSFDGGNTFETSQFTSTSEISGLVAGSYEITIVDANGCLLTHHTNANITEPDVITATLNVTNITCNGDNNGQVAVSASGGTGSLLYGLDGVNGDLQSGSVFSNLSVGLYTVTVVDESLCSQDFNFSISEPSLLAINITKTDAECEGGALGTYNINFSGGVPPYTFTFGNLPEMTGPSMGGTARAGSYDIHVVDANGCEANERMIIENLVTIVPSEVSVTPLSCSNASDGAVEITATGGAAPYMYSKDGINFQSSGMFTGMGSGYYITVLDANGCMAAIGGSIPTPDPLTVQADATNLNCFEENDGEIAISASGGTTPYQYSLDGTNFQPSSIFSGLAVGEYEITVRDANGCQRLWSAIVEGPDQLELSVVQNDQDFALTASGGTEPYEYSSDGTNYQNASAFTNLGPDVYTFYVRDANGCISESDVFEVVLGISDDIISIYPNPTSDKLYVESKPHKLKSLRLINLSGKVLLEESSSAQMDISQLVNGTYILQIEDQDGQRTSHRVLKR